MLLEIAIGDAYGAAFEYANQRFVRERNNLVSYYQHPRHGIRPGCYTDDTQMSLAVAEVIVQDVPWTPNVLGDKFVEAFKRDPREGYAGGFYHFLQEVQDGEEFLARIRPRSDKSGAAMRAAPTGIFSTPAEVVERCTVQARLTHDTPDGIAAACAAALASHYFLYRHGPKAGLGRFLEEHVPGQWNEPWTGKVGAKGWMSVRAAITAVMAHGRLSDILRASIDFTGDVDTVAAIAMGAASCSEEIEQDLPKVLRHGLENGRFGRDYLQDLDQQLLAKVTTQRGGQR